jgi:glycerol-3-phosphate dehydrogenase subunit C
MRALPDWPNADACVKCHVCTTACPVFRVDTAFLGPKVLGPDWYRRALAGDVEPDPHVDDCTFCQLCEAACPVGVPIAHLIAAHKAQQRRPLRRRVRDFVFVRPHWLARLPALAQVTGSLGTAMGLSAHARRPRPRRLPPGRRPKAGSRTVALFVDCFSRSYDPDPIVAAERLLAAIGYEVVRVPEEPACCGAAAYASGQPDTAQAIARTTAARLRLALAGVRALLTVNATCDGTLRDEWPAFFREPLPVPVLPVVEFLAREAPPGFFDRTVPDPTEVFLHTTCRGKVARGVGAFAAWTKRWAPQQEALDLACCGAAGSYAFKAEHEAVAMSLGHEAAAQVAGRSGRLLVDSGPCALHLGQMTGLTTLHPVSWLYERWSAGEGGGAGA